MPANLGRLKRLALAADIFRRFAVRAAVVETIANPTFLQNVPGQLAPIEAAVVPLRQVGIDFGGRPEAGQRARLRGTLA